MGRKKKEVQPDSHLQQLSPMEELVLSQQRLLLLGKLVGGLAHEIKTPLSFVKQYNKISTDLAVELQKFLEKRHSKFTSQETQELAEIIETFLDSNNEVSDSANRIDRLITDVLFQFKPPVIVPSLVNTLIEENVKLAYHTMRATDKQFNTGITYNLDSSLGAIDLSSDFRLAIVHLAINAFYSLREKKLSDPDFKPHLLVTTRNTVTYVEIIFHDNGVGLSEEMIDKIFEPFFTTKPDAFGLGLSFVKDIIVRHNGQIKVVAVPNNYAKFVIMIPREIL